MSVNIPLDDEFVIKKRRVKTSYHVSRCISHFTVGSHGIRFIGWGASSRTFGISKEEDKVSGMSHLINQYSALI